jgi:hypothetical protein
LQDQGKWKQNKEKPDIEELGVQEIHRHTGAGYTVAAGYAWIYGSWRYRSWIYSSRIYKTL